MLHWTAYKIMNASHDDAQTDISAEPTAQTINDELFEEMRTLRERIKARRSGKLITVDIVEQVRAERDEELLGKASPQEVRVPPPGTARRLMNIHKISIIRDGETARRLKSRATQTKSACTDYLEESIRVVAVGRLCNSCPRL